VDDQPRIVDCLEIQRIFGESQIHEMVIGRGAFDVRVITSDAAALFAGRSRDDVMNSIYWANFLVKMFVSGEDDVHVLDDFGFEHSLQVGIRAVALGQQAEPIEFNIGMDRMVEIDNIPAIAV